MISMTWPQYLRRQCSVDGKSVQLTGGEMNLLHILLMGYPRVWSRDDLMEAAYPIEEYDDRQPFDKIIEVFICRLRKKCGKQYFETVRGRGYRFVQPPPSIEELTPPAMSSIMPAVETTTTQETEDNAQGNEDRVQDYAEAGAGHEEYLCVQERRRRRADPVALYREVGLPRRRAEDDHGFGRRGLTGVQRRRLQRRVDLLLRIYPHLRARS